MNFNSMTIEHFWLAADTWYQRTHRLREIFINESETEVRRFKASKLWRIMFVRMLEVNKIATSLRVPKAPNGMKSGGVSFKGIEFDRTKEYIISPKRD